MILNGLLLFGGLGTGSGDTIYIAGGIDMSLEVQDSDLLANYENQEISLGGIEQTIEASPGDDISIDIETSETTLDIDNE